MSRIIRLVTDPHVPDLRVLERAAEVVRAGGVVAIPTDTFYGLAANPFKPEAVARIFRVKERSAERAIPLVGSGRDQVAEWLGELPALGARLADRFWPGPLTLLLSAPPSLAAEVTGGTGKVGVRVPAHAITRALCEMCGHPLTATSANLSGQPACDQPQDVERSLESRLDALVDAGPTAGGPASTIVDVTGGQVILVRSGAIPWEDVRQWLSLA
jgi:L-threonylcarbamoyladenylate synthase